MISRIQHIEIHQLLEYLRSRDLTPEEWAALETYAAGDLFLLEALEGLRQIPVAQRLTHLQSIQALLTAKYSKQKPVRRTTNWMRAAASILLLIGMFWIVNNYILRDRDRIIAEDISEQNEPFVADEALTYSDSIAMSKAGQETPAGSFDGPRIQSSSSESSHESAKKDVTNDITSTGTETKATSDQMRESGADADGVRPAPSASSTPPTLTESFSSERLSRESEGDGASFLLPEVKGIVMNRSGEPVRGALVSVKGTNTETETDYLGNFALDIPNQNYRNALVISHDAYPVVEADVADGDSLVVRLQEPTSNDKADITTLAQNRLAKVAVPGSRSMAMPVSGERAYQKYIRQNLQYPTRAANAGIHGTVVVEFDISSDGSPQNIRIVQSVGYGCDEEAIRLILEGPKWSSTQVNIGRWEVNF